MSVVSVTRKLGGSASDSCPDGQQFSQGRDVPYDVVVDDPTDTESLVLASPAVPQPRAPHPDGLYLRVSNRQAVKVSPVKFELTATYTSPSKPGQSPLDQPPEIEFDAIATEEFVDTDFNGDPVIMITGEEFDPKPKELFFTPVVRVTRNVVFIDPVVIAEYRNAVNSDNWYGLPPGTVRISTIRARRVFDEDFTYWQVTGEFQIRRAAPGSTDAKAWYLRLLAQGYLVTFNVGLLGDQTFHALDAAGQPVTKPVLHDITTGEEITDNADAQWYEFQTKPSLPFAALGLL